MNQSILSFSRISLYWLVGFHLILIMIRSVLLLSSSFSSSSTKDVDDDEDDFKSGLVYLISARKIKENYSTNYIRYLVFALELEYKKNNLTPMKYTNEFIFFLKIMIRFKISTFYIYECVCVSGEKEDLNICYN